MKKIIIDFIDGTTEIINMNDFKLANSFKSGLNLNEEFIRSSILEGCIFEDIKNNKYIVSSSIKSYKIKKSPYR